MNPTSKRLEDALEEGIVSIVCDGDGFRVTVHHENVPCWKTRPEEWDRLKKVYRGAMVEAVMAFADRVGVSGQIVYMFHKEIIKNVYEHGTMGGHLSFRKEGTFVRGEFHTYASGPIDLAACVGKGWVRKSEDNAGSGLAEIEQMRDERFECQVDTSKGVFYKTALDLSKF